MTKEELEIVKEALEKVYLWEEDVKIALEIIKKELYESNK